MRRAFFFPQPSLSLLFFLISACDDPAAIEMADIASRQLNLPTMLENKKYPRDFWQHGRIRVKLFDVSGGPANPAVPSKKALMEALAAACPAHPHYQARKKAEAEALASWNRAPAQVAAMGGGGGGSAAPRVAAAPGASGARAATGRTSSKKKGRQMRG